MFGKILARLIWVPLVVVFCVFLIANRQSVAISLDPFSTENPALQTFAFPLWVWLIMFLMAGFGLGVFGAWVSGRTQRLQAHADRKALQALKKENAVLAAQSTGKAPLIVAEG